MLGLLGTVAGAAALEIKRLHKRGSIEELRETKQRERELRRQLEATHHELEKVRLHSDAAEEKASQMESKAESLEHEKEQLQQQAAELGQQREQLQQNNSKLLITNLMLLNKARQLEDHSRALVAKQDDLQHQLEQLQRENVAAEANFEASLAALKDQVTGVLNRYFSKDIDLQHAIGEMQQMGIEVVPADDMARLPEDTMDFQTRLVLDSPHRMQRLMSRQLSQLTAGLPHDSEVPRLAQYSFPLGISKDPATGAPRITLGWRADPQAQGSLSSRASSSNDVQPQLADQQEASSSKKAQLAIKDTYISSDTSKMQQGNGSSKAATVQDGPAGAALTFASPQKTKAKQHSSPFSLPSFSSLGFRTSSNGSNGPMAKAVIRNGSIKGDHHDDVFMANSKDLVSRKH